MQPSPAGAVLLSVVLFSSHRESSECGRLELSRCGCEVRSGVPPSPALWGSCSPGHCCPCPSSLSSDALLPTRSPVLEASRGVHQTLINRPSFPFSPASSLDSRPPPQHPAKALCQPCQPFSPAPRSPPHLWRSPTSIRAVTAGPSCPCMHTPRSNKGFEPPADPQPPCVCAHEGLVRGQPDSQTVPMPTSIYHTPNPCPHLCGDGAWPDLS